MTNGLTDGMSTFTPFSQYIPENCLEKMKADRPTLRNVFFSPTTSRRAEARRTNTEIRGKGLTAEEAENNIGRGGERGEGEEEGAWLAISSGQNSRRREGRIFVPTFFGRKRILCSPVSASARSRGGERRGEKGGEAGVSGASLENVLGEEEEGEGERGGGGGECLETRRAVKVF